MLQCRKDFLISSSYVTAAICKMSWYLILLGCLFLVSQSQSILLCDEDCKSNQELEICQATPKNKTVLNVMAFFPCNSPDFRARGLTVAGQMAVRRIVNSSLLPGYIFKLNVNNTMCSALPAIRSFIDQLGDIQRTGAQRYMIIGPGCSVGAATTAEVSPFYSLTQIGYTSTAIDLSDHPNFLRTISSDHASVASVTSIVREFGWRQIAIVSVRNALFTNLTGAQISALRQEGVNVLSEHFAYNENPSNEMLETIVSNLNESGARIVLLNILEDDARRVFCMAYQRGMLFPRYTFISYFWYSEGWWMDLGNETRVNCTVQELTDAIIGSIAVDHFPSADPGDMTQVGYNSTQEFWDDYESIIKSLGYKDNEAIRQAAFVYDAVWLAAHALHSTLIQLKKGTVPGASSLENFNHFKNSTLARQINQLIWESARSTKFLGVSGLVKLNRHGYREAKRRIYQYLYQDSNMSEVFGQLFASVNTDLALKFSPGSSQQTVYPDGVTMDVEVVSIHVALFGVYTALACVGVGFAVACIVFNMVFRKKRLVKLSSPYLNLLIIAGAILFYIVVILFGIDTTIASDEVVGALRCQLSVWLASIAFSLLFGTMLVKTWRVYYIFKNFWIPKRPLKDWILFLIVMAMVALDVVFLIIATIPEELRIELNPQPLQLQMGGELPLFLQTCSSPASNYWIPILLIYKALYLVVGLFLAAQTYNVKLKRLRDSRLIVTCVCTVAVVCLVATIVAFTVMNPTISYLVYGLLILVVITAILAILFGTMMIELYKTPSGKVDVKMVSGTVLKSKYKYSDRSTTAKSEDQAKIDQLKQTICSLKDEIETKKRATCSNVNLDSTTDLDDCTCSSHSDVTSSYVVSTPDVVITNNGAFQQVEMKEWY